VPASQEEPADQQQQQQQQGDEEDATEDEDEEGLVNSDSPGKEQRHQHGYQQQGLHSGSCGGVKRQRLGFDSPAEPVSQPHALADILNQQHQQLGGSAGAGKAGAAGGGSFGAGGFVFEHHVGGSDRDDFD
jgi:hypothetical protein